MSGLIKLRLSELGLYGREKELSILQECYRRVDGSDGDGEGDAASGGGGGGGGGGGKFQVALVTGGAGTGKSSLVRRLANDTDDSLFCSGKFDDPRATTGQPYAALRSAFGELVALVLETFDETERKAMGEAIDKAVGSNGIDILKMIVPGIRRLVVHDAGDETASVPASVATSTADASRINSSEALNRLIFALRSFLRSVCSSSHPVILFLDDLQWADQASLQMIRSVATDGQLQHILLVGAYRNEEVDEVSHPLTRMLQETEDDKRPITRIQLSNLDVATIRRLVAGLLWQDVSEVAELAEAVHQRTGGNAFFVLQFLSMLQERGLLLYNLLKYEWTWDIEQIRSETDMSENVVEFVALKIQRLPQRVATVLKIMACFPSTKVDVAFLESILKGLDMVEFASNSDASTLVLILDEASEEGLVDKIGSDSFRFTHDRIREGAYSLIPEGQERDIFHLKIGEIVMDLINSDESAQEWMKFVAADQLNRGCAFITDEKQRLELVSLNLEAGELAMSASAFAPAAEFFDKGIVLLRVYKDHWTQNYDISLKLYSFAAEAAYCTGDFDLQARLVDEVLANGKYLRDKLPVYCSFVESLTAQQKLDDAMNTGFYVLTELGERFPKRLLLLHVLADFQKTKKMLRKYSDEQLLSLPPLENEDMIVAVRLMIYLFRCAYFMQRLETMVLLLLRQLQLMLRFGLSGDSPYVFACYGMLLCGGLGDIKEGCRFGKLALKLLERYNEQKTQVLLLAHSFVVHWQSPVQDQIDPLLRAHKLGMVSGDVVNAFLCSVGYSYFFYHAGLPLRTLEKDIRAHSQLMDEYRQELAYMEVIPLFQGILNLMGRSDDPLILSGEAMVQDEFLEDAEERCIPTATQKVFLVRMQLAYYFGDIGLAAEMLESCKKLMATITAHMVYEVFTFFRGLIYMEQARRTKKWKYRRSARGVMKTMKKWVQDRGVNCVHKLWLLEAEYATLNRRGSRPQKDKIMNAFDSAISAAARSGLVHDAALANERAGLWFQSLGDEFWASSYLSRAHDLYLEWGADAKADDLRRCFGVGGASQDELARGKSRFDGRNSQQHKKTNLAQLSRRSFSSGSFTEKRGSALHTLTSSQRQADTGAESS